MFNVRHNAIKGIRNIFSLAGLEIARSKHRNDAWYPIELNTEEREIVSYVLRNKLTMVSFERVISTALAVKYVIENEIDGDFVECGVWRGGNSIIAASIIKLYKSNKRVWLFDTFSGMTPPSSKDVDMYGASAVKKYTELPKDSSDSLFWCISTIQEVKANFEALGLLDDKIRFVEGDILQTLKEKENIPRMISVLRLDTDWYESTRYELEVLYPKLKQRGCLIIDDYGHWSGSRFAAEEYFEAIGTKPFLHYIDNAGRVGVKV